MDETTKMKIRRAVHGALEELFENDEQFLDLFNGMYWGQNTTQLAADSAANVLIACCESQAEAEESGI